MNAGRLAGLFAAIVASASTGACDRCDENEVESRGSRDIKVGADGKVINSWDDAGTSDAGTPGGVVVVSDCKAPCMENTGANCGRTELESCSVVTSTSEYATVRCNYAYYPACLPAGTVCGRRSEGVRFAPCDATTPLGVLFGGMASLEGASVPAFRRIGRELQSLGAPRRLVRRARRSARDEIAHTRATSRLARRFGARVATFELAAARERSVLELALENAVEGCIREAFGALVATYQATHARDREIRAVMVRIARDETRHASLAREIDRFLGARLTRVERTLVASAKRAALAELAEQIDASAHPEALHAAGVPEPRIARVLLARAEQLLAS